MMAKREISKIGVILFLILIVATISYAEKISANNGVLERLDNITGFADEKTSSVLKADVRDSHGRVFLIVKALSNENDKISFTMDLRNPTVNYYNGQMTGYAKIRYKITNNGRFAINPVPDEKGHFHHIRIGQKETVIENKIENVIVTFNDDNTVDIYSDSFEVTGLIVR